jgi:tetratricopeptide (TPR) repeat protein
MTRFCLFSFFWFQVLTGFAQAFETGLAFEKKFQDQAALAWYEKAIQENQQHPLALTHASRMLSNLAGRLAVEQKTDKTKLLKKARSYAERAISMDSTNAQAHLARVVALGIQSEIAAGASEKVKMAKEIYDEAQTMLKLDSTLSVAHFIMGKWHFELARLNMMERLACDLFFGGMPDGVSMEKALAYFKKASELEPNTILYLYGEARVYGHLDDNKKAILLLKKAIALPNREPDDDIRREKCRVLLKTLEE